MKPLVGASAVAAALALSACGEAASTSSFKGESKNVAQAIANFQSDATARDQSKLCGSDLSSAIVAHLKSGGGCEAVLKQQLGEIDTLDLTIESISVTAHTASARVKSTWSGKDQLSTVYLTKEAGHWKISGAAAP